MTMVSYDARIDRPSRRSSSAAAALQHLSALAENVRTWHRRRLEARALEALPPELRKDLGWPGADGLARPNR